ncbi:hypothetical protein C0995_003930 [Termitomyces sp. Mi166|nr:hypothetical protein C0995_003930 [Termitomyces sp. Mi166\
MKYSTTVLLSVLAFPYLVNARPSSRRGAKPDDVESIESYFLQGQSDLQESEGSLVNTERRWIKRQVIGASDYIRDGHGVTTMEASGYRIDLDDSVSHLRQGNADSGSVTEFGQSSPSPSERIYPLYDYFNRLDDSVPKKRRDTDDHASFRNAIPLPVRSLTVFHNLFISLAAADIDILNVALSFEHLVAAFYKRGLEKYGVRKFRGAGYEGWIRRRFEQIAKNGRTHIEFLQSALGEKAVKACGYDLYVSFGYLPPEGEALMWTCRKDKDVSEWVSKSFVVENIAASAWNGVVGILQDRSYQTVAASIMGVKARHAAWINSVVRKSNAWNTAFETPLDMNQIYSVMAPFVIAGSCPSTNPPLRATLFPALHIPPCRPGSVITLEYDSPAAKEAEKQKQQLFAAFVSGTGTVFVSMRAERKVEVPKGLVGVVYVFVTKDGGKVGNEGIVAGPGVVWFGFGA